MIFKHNERCRIVRRIRCNFLVSLRYVMPNYNLANTVKNTVLYCGS